MQKKEDAKIDPFRWRRKLFSARTDCLIFSWEGNRGCRKGGTTSLGESDPGGRNEDAVY